METDEGLSDAEYLQKIRMEYFQAAQLEDYGRIGTVILPQFIKRFGKHYDEYGKGWRDLSLSRVSIEVIIDPREQKEKELHWAENVLKGQIELLL